MDYRSMVNPTFLTAKSTLLMLAGMGNEDAQKVIAALGTQDELTQTGRNEKQKLLSDADLKELMAGVSMAIKARYEALSRIMRAEGYTALLDIACGYTPRSLYCSKEGIDYAGLDVPVVAEEMQQMAAGLGIGGDHPVYVGGDATNAASLNAAADMLKGKLLISCEGLLGYLSANEFEQLLGGIREVLKKHGGAWVSSDFGVDYESFATTCMSSPDAVELYNAAKHRTMTTSDIYNDGVATWDDEKSEAFISSHGLKVEKLPFYYDDQESDLMEGLPDNWKQALKSRLKSSVLWKMTLDTAAVPEEKIKGAKEVENLKIDYSKENGVLNCEIHGRVDTISAPALLEVFETSYDGISAVKVDAASLEYISSAGLRVLLMAVKKLGPGSVCLVNTTESVKDIFSTTGFDQMVKVE